MKTKKINTPAAGTWSRDCELLYLLDQKGFELSYHKDEDDTYWKLKCHKMVAYKLISEELSTKGYLIGLPIEGAFFEIVDSPWIKELRNEEDRMLHTCKHYVLQFYDETVEILAQELLFEKLTEKPSAIILKIT